MSPILRHFRHANNVKLTNLHTHTHREYNGNENQQTTIYVCCFILQQSIDRSIDRLFNGNKSSNTSTIITIFLYLFIRPFTFTAILIASVWKCVFVAIFCASFSSSFLLLLEKYLYFFQQGGSCRNGRTLKERTLSNRLLKIDTHSSSINKNSKKNSALLFLFVCIFEIGKRE